MLQREPSGAGKAEHAPTIHTDAPGVTPLTPVFEHAMTALELHGKRRKLMTLLGWRVTRGAVIHWRKGRHAAPAWALETIRTALDARRQIIDHATALVQAELEKRKP